MMRFKFIPAAVSAALAISLLGATGASAATEFGDACTGNEPLEAPVTLFEISATSNPLPTAAPVSGVITKMKVNLIGGAPVIPVNLKVLRQIGPETVQIVGEANGNIVGGTTSTIDTRISVLAGDRLGFFSPSKFGPIVCEEEGGASLIGGYEGSGGGPGSSATFVSIPAAGVRIPLFAVIEPDADNDGFGDETQDQCPQNAAVQVACPVIPVVALSTSAVAKKGLMTVLITSSTQAPVTVTGTAKLGKGKTAKLNGGTQIVAPGAIARFTLLFPQKLKNKLKQLSPKQRLTVNVVATAVNSAGQPSTRALKVKLKGQAKPKKPRRQAKS
jgi:hypothetical protein